MAVSRIVPDLEVADAGRAAAFYRDVFDLRVGMHIGWVANLAPADAPAVQLQLVTQDAAAAVNPAISIGVDGPAEVDAVHAEVVARGLEVVHPVTDEAWGVRRFFFRDPDCNVINVVANR